MRLGARPPNWSFRKLLQVRGGVGRVESKDRLKFTGIIQRPGDVILQ